MSIENLADQFVTTLERFEYRLNSLNPYWEILFPGKDQKWHHLMVYKHENTFSISHSNGDNDSLEIIPREHVKVSEGFREFRPFYEEEEEEWVLLFQAALDWLKEVEKDWMQANLKIQTDYPLEFRWGTIWNSLVQATWPKAFQLAKKLGTAKTKQFLDLYENGFFNPFTKPTADSMTAATFFNYCKIAYQATIEDIEPNLSGSDLYKIYADGRHEGLLEIDPQSEQEFADWLDHKHPKRERGGHPWEIKRGGSYTHIGMRVQRPGGYSKKGFTIELYGHSSFRLADTITMFLAIQEAGLPIHIVRPEEIWKQLKGFDRVGIVPAYESLNRTTDHFLEEEDVFEAVYYEDLKKYKTQLTPFIKWESLPILKLRSF